MDIHCPSFMVNPYRKSIEMHPAIRICPPLEDDTVFFRTLAEADILLIPANFDADTVQFIRYSMPTRVPAYLATGRPILVYAPPQIAQTKYARECEWGLVVDEQGVANVKSGIVRLIEDRSLREKLTEAAGKVARENHDATRVRSGFQQALRDAAVIH